MVVLEVLVIHSTRYILEVFASKILKDICSWNLEDFCLRILISSTNFSSTGRPALVLYPGENKRPRTNSIQQIVKTTVSFFSPSPDEPIPERIIGLTDAEREEGAFRVDPAGANTHWIPTHLRRVWDEIYSTLGVSTCLVEHHSNPINFILVDLHRPANMDGFKLKA